MKCTLLPLLWLASGLLQCEDSSKHEADLSKLGHSGSRVKRSTTLFEKSAGNLFTLARIASAVAVTAVGVTEESREH